MSLPIEYFLRVTSIFTIALAVTSVWRRGSPALRHLIWICAFGVAAATPLFLQFGPRIRIESLAPAVAMEAAPVSSFIGPPVAAASHSHPVRPTTIPSLEIAWLIGTLVCLTRIWTASRKTRALLKDAVAIEPGVAESDAIATPMTLGVFRRLILLPREHRLWDAELLRGVLLHEREHVRRRDCLTQWLPNLICAVHWFNPVVWFARSEMLCEAERACDDAVVRAGVSGGKFARDLVGIVQSLQEKGNSLMSTAVTTKLERRIARLVDPAADRRSLSAVRAASITGVALLLLGSIAGVKAERTFKAPEPVVPNLISALTANPPKPVQIAQAAHAVRKAVPLQVAQAAPSLSATVTDSKGAVVGQLAFQVAQGTPSGSLSGVVTDPTGAVIVGATVQATTFTVSNADTGGGRGSAVQAYSAVSGPTGQWSFSSLPAGTYGVEITAPGFARFSRSVAISAGGNSQVKSPLAIGRISEAVTITAEKAGLAAPLSAAQPQTGPIHVGGMAEPARLIRKVTPAFPPSAKAQGIEGSVTIEAIIDKAGFVASARAVGGSRPELAQAALDAVQQWQYTPARLNGEPVDVMTEITMSFTLQ